MIRFASEKLDQWLGMENRKPMVIRGARQVGKTWLVRDFAKRNSLKLIELNFERFPNLADLFSGNNPQKTIENLESEFETSISPGSSLLFLDEIQAAPGLFSKLRWFKEEMAELPVIAAGSLLEFALNNNEYSMPVGRITYFFLEPLSFFEFIVACGKNFLYEKLCSFAPDETLPISLHEKCLDLYSEYCLTGGMPETVKQWTSTKDLKACIKTQHDLLATFRDDFHKYGGRFDPALLNRIFFSVSRQLGNKFVYNRVDPDAKALQIKKGLSMLSFARILTQVFHTTGNGIPLGAETNEKFFKMLFLDVGLVSVQLGMSSMKLSKAKKTAFSNKGGLAEQFIGQQLRSALAPDTDPLLFYWQRTGGRQGEIDYVLQHRNRVLPLEIKSGNAGSMKSLHQFMSDKKLDLAIRCNTNLPSFETVNVKTTLGVPVSYRLFSIPLYLAERLYDLVDMMQGSLYPS